MDFFKAAPKIICWCNNIQTVRELSGKMSAAGLKTHIWNNNLRSVLLLASYPLLICGLAWAIGFAFHYSFVGEMGAMHGYYNGTAETGSLRGESATGFANGIILQYWPSILTIVAIWFIVAYFLQTRMVRALSHARPVTRAEEPELYNMLENLCISRGMKTPRLEIIETRARNAFASGIDDRSYAITVTRGLLQSLQPDEVEAVLGHELTHIMNRDVRLLIVSIIFTGMIGFLAQLAWSSIRYQLYFGGHGKRRSDFRIVLILMAVAAILWVGYMATMFTRFALSRRREYMADAGAVELTKNPDAMMRALMRLAGKDKIPEATDDIALMCIENSRKFFGLFTTHPPLEERIKAISQVTGTPIPELHPGLPAEQGERFKAPKDTRKGDSPWLTATRRGRSSPWDR